MRRMGIRYTSNQMQYNNLIIEIGCEELPPKKLGKLASALAENFKAELDKMSLSYKEVASYAAPRRLALRVTQLQQEQPARSIERQGPSLKAAYDKEGSPTIACLGFAKSCNVSIDQLSVKETDKGSWVICHITEPGRDIIELLPSFLQDAVRKLPIAKPMRWGANEYDFVRPVQWITMLLGNQAVPGSLFGCEFSAKTFGHRFHAPQALQLKHADDYLKDLKIQGQVIVDFDERKNLIRHQIETAAKNYGHALIDEKLLNEVTGLVEWPEVLIGRFNPEFLKVPREALITAMQSHQKCFAIEKSPGQLAPFFILVSNIHSKDPAIVVKGNERVMKARLSDAAFFYHKDCQTSLAKHHKELNDVMFQKQLGSMGDKTKRLQKNAEYIAKQLGLSPENVKRAAGLAKCDLLSEMVGEFPELQGIMGYYYALHDKEEEAVAIAIRDHYSPRFASDQLPASKEAACLALADRLDTIVGIIGINKLPTGDKDPYAVRRAALGLLRILIEKNLRLDLKQLLKHAIAAFAVDLPNKKVLEQSEMFINERLRYWYLEKEVSQEIFNSVVFTEYTDLMDFNQRILAVKQFQKLPEAGALAAANKRVGNILKKEANAHIPKSISEKLFDSDAEKALFSSLNECRHQFEILYDQENYTQALASLAILKAPIDEFFDKVMIMVDDKKVRENRLALLTSLRRIFTQVADISLLP